MKHFNVRDTLIARTISVIAEEGLDKTTTKAIVRGTDINEAYIYRHFSDKKDLLAKVFEKLDSELVDKATQHIPVMYARAMDYETRCRYFFFAMWKFLLGNKEKCLSFIRYYYSPYFQKYSAEAHKQRYEELVANFEDAFVADANAWILLNHILNVMLDFAVKVFNGDLPNDDNTASQVFRLVYSSVKPYFKNNTELLNPV